MKNRISIVVMTVIAIVFAVNYFAADKVVSKKPVEKSDFLPKDKKKNWRVC